MSRDYLTVDYVLQIHAEQIERYGGSAGVRYRAGLEAAVARHRSGYYENVIQEAAALWESLSQNHPCVDGNKRTAFSATNRFLGLNDMRITASPDRAYAFISDAFERRQMGFETLEAWLSANTKLRE